MINTEIIRAREHLIAFIKSEQTALVEAGADTFKNNQPLTLTMQDKRVVIEKGDHCTYKQFFPLMLKYTWETDDLRLITGFCALIWLLNTQTKTPTTKPHNLHIIETLCLELWVAAFYHNDPNEPKSSEKLCISGIEHALDISKPLNFVNSLPINTVLFSTSKNRIGFIQARLIFIANIPFEHHAYREGVGHERPVTTIDGEAYRVTYLPTVECLYNTFHWLEKEEFPRKVNIKNLKKQPANFMSLR
jgi:hypothetical protein